jgi:predicted GNAT family N-acyltransferase
MDVLIDTNIFIYREDPGTIPISLQKLQRAINEASHSLIVHPLSADEIRNDPNDSRRESAVSRLETYRELEYPNYPGPTSPFRDQIPEQSGNDHVDNMLLYAVFNDDVDFLITEDTGIHEKAARIGLSDRVFSIEEGEEFFTEDSTTPIGPESIEATTLGNLDLDDEIFDSLKGEYDEFVDWAHAHADRKTWVNYREDGSLGAILVIKPNETEKIGDDPPLERSRRFKISTMKVSPSRRGSKLGELLISIAVREAISHRDNEIYLTHYVNEGGQDHLVRLIGQYGFRYVSNMTDGEAIFRKYLKPPPGSDPTPVELSNEFYPSFYNGNAVSKFIVPVQPEYHERLFTSYQFRQSTEGNLDEIGSEGNAIEKAYLTHSNTKKVDEGDLLLFYRSHDDMAITSLGVCEKVYLRLTDAEEIKRVVGKRSVYTDVELRELAVKPTTVFMFTWHFDLPTPLSYEELIEEGILSGGPQATTEINHQDYKLINERGEIDGRFTCD